MSDLIFQTTAGLSQESGATEVMTFFSSSPVGHQHYGLDSEGKLFIDPDALSLLTTPGTSAYIISQIISSVRGRRKDESYTVV